MRGGLSILPTKKRQQPQQIKNDSARRCNSTIIGVMFSYRMEEVHIFENSFVRIKEDHGPHCVQYYSHKAVATHFNDAESCQIFEQQADVWTVAMLFNIHQFAQTSRPATS